MQLHEHNVQQHSIYGSHKIETDRHKAVTTVRQRDHIFAVKRVTFQALTLYMRSMASAVQIN